MRHTQVRGILIPEPENYSDCITLQRSDYCRWTGNSRPSVLKMWLKRWRLPAYGYMYYYRLCQHRGILYPYFRLRLEKYVRKYGLQIPLDARIGYGLYLGHGLGIIVNGTAVIGNNVNLSQFTTIGSVKGTAGTIGDNCYIGPQVCLVEDVTIGHNAIIGAGAVVVKDIPAESTAAGVPAKVIKENTANKPAFQYTDIPSL